ncbi:hypothetical protein GS884_07635 [Rhodococcus hoagii]|nr:hypothetical protein [Prescottella equi]
MLVCAAIAAGLPPLCRDRDGRCGAGRSVRRAGTGAGPGAVAVGHDAGVSAPAGDRLPHHRRDGDCVLNVSDSYAPAAWAPVVNNGVVLAAAVGFVLLPGPVTLTPTSMTTAQILVLGIGTTAGIGAQAAWTVRALRRTGFRWSWRVRPVPYTLRPVRVGARMIGWILVYA